jgi:uncharacterized membrane protein YfcA
VPHLEVVGLALVALCIFLYGLSKTAMPVAGVVAGTLVAGVLGPAQATGFLVPLLVLGDLFALFFYRSHVDWRLILRVIPGVLVGFVLTALIFALLPQAWVARIVGMLILISLLLELRRQWQVRRGEEVDAAPGDVKDHRIVTAMFGVLAGMTTMGANAGGTALSIYLIRLRVPMLAFMGTAAWFFFILNVCKAPFVIALGYLTWDSVLFDVWFVVPLVLGALGGAFVFRRMSQTWFTRIALGLSGIAAIWLIIVG